MTRLCDLVDRALDRFLRADVHPHYLHRPDETDRLPGMGRALARSERRSWRRRKPSTGLGFFLERS